MNASAHLKFEFFGLSGECKITPIDEPNESTEWRQLVDVYMVINDPDNTLLELALFAAGSLENVPNYLIGTVAEIKAGIWDFDSTNSTMTESWRTNSRKYFHLHTYGTTAAFDLVIWNDEFALASMLHELGIDKPK